MTKCEGQKSWENIENICDQFIIYVLDFISLNYKIANK